MRSGAGCFCWTNRLLSIHRYQTLHKTFIKRNHGAGESQAVRVRVGTCALSFSSAITTPDPDAKELQVMHVVGTKDCMRFINLS